MLRSSRLCASPGTATPSINAIALARVLFMRISPVFRRDVRELGQARVHSDGAVEWTRKRATMHLAGPANVSLDAYRLTAANNERQRAGSKGMNEQQAARWARLFLRQYPGSVLIKSIPRDS